MQRLTLFAIFLIFFDTSYGFLLFKREPLLKSNLYQTHFQPKREKLLLSNIDQLNLDHQFIPKSKLLPISNLSSSGLSNVVIAFLIVALTALSRQYAQDLKYSVNRLIHWTLRKLRKVSLLPLFSRREAKHTHQRDYFGPGGPIRQPIRQTLRPVSSSSPSRYSNRETILSDPRELTTQEKRASSTVSSSAWKVARFESKEVLNDRFVSYKFRLPREDREAFAQQVSKKVILCTVDRANNVLKGSYYALPSPFSRSHLEVIVPSSSSLPEEEEVSTNADQDQTLRNILSELQLEDEIAVKVDPSSPVVKYRGSEETIDSLAFIASGIGIVPTLSLLRKIFQSKTSREGLFQVESCVLLWINPEKEAFIYNHEIERLERDFADRFTVARVVDVDIAKEGTVLNPKLIEHFPSYEAGKVPVLAVESSVIAKKFTQALSGALGYDQNNIVSFPI